MASDDNIAPARPARSFEIVRGADKLRGFARGKPVAHETSAAALDPSYAQLGARVSAPMGKLYGTGPRDGGARPKRG